METSGERLQMLLSPVVANGRDTIRGAWLSVRQRNVQLRGDADSRMSARTRQTADDRDCRRRDNTESRRSARARQMPKERDDRCRNNTESRRSTWARQSLDERDSRLGLDRTESEVSLRAILNNTTFRSAQWLSFLLPNLTSDSVWSGF